MTRLDSTVGRRPQRGPRRLGLVALGVLAVVVVAVLVPLAREARWQGECARRGGHLAHAAVDTDPLLAPGSRLVHTCSSPDGLVLATWSW